jgi:hypothetical protein
VATAPPPQQALAWEAEHRNRIAGATLAAAVLTALGAIVTGIGLSNLPKYEERIVSVTDALRLAAQGQPIPSGRLAAQALYLGHHAAAPIAGAILYGLGTLLIFPAAGYLFRATRARRPQLPQLALVMAAIGAVGFGIGRTVAEVARYLGATHFVDQADHSNSAAADALGGTVALAGQVIWQAGALAFGFAFVLIALNAMRVGLLTRFMGILGVIVGVTFVLPLDQQGIIRVFWLGALGVLIAGRWPRGVPPAWASGQAEPWPTQQELREARQAAREGQAPAPAERAQPAGDAVAEPARAPAAPPAPRRPEPAAERHSASRKRKRKRRS